MKLVNEANETKPVHETKEAEQRSQSTKDISTHADQL